VYVYDQNNNWLSWNLAIIDLFFKGNCFIISSFFLNSIGKSNLCHI
jgi:hypothetical protein